MRHISDKAALPYFIFESRLYFTFKNELRPRGPISFSAAVLFHSALFHGAKAFMGNHTNWWKFSLSVCSLEILTHRDTGAVGIVASCTRRRPAWRWLCAAPGRAGTYAVQCPIPPRTGRPGPASRRRTRCSCAPTVPLSHCPSHPSRSVLCCAV